MKEYDMRTLKNIAFAGFIYILILMSLIGRNNE